jgi:DNA-binding transcriptional ArsR family regulator
MAKRKEKINAIFKAIADPTRREIFHVLMVATAAMSLSQIAQQFDMSRQGVTKHIKLLEEAGLINISEQGRERFCEANPTPLDEIKNWMAVYDRFWDDKLSALGKHLKGK